ncbi:MAG: thioredoxin domain-containing protein [Streptococcus sp.]|nr:thioredoxin domain-containing protein [Streptococcus sp.]
MKDLKIIKFGFGIVLFIMILSFAVIGVKTVWQESILKDYDSHLTQKEYTEVIDKNVNLVFYKPGCAYCHAGKKAVISAAEKSIYTTFFINVESVEGQVLVKKYQVKKAATIITLRDGKSKLYLYAAKDQKGKIKADEKAIKEALND